MYGLRGRAPCVSCIGLGLFSSLLKEIKSFKSMLKNQNISSLLTKQLRVSLDMKKCELSFVYFASKFK